MPERIVANVKRFDGRVDQRVGQCGQDLVEKNREADSRPIVNGDLASTVCEAEHRLESQLTSSTSASLRCMMKSLKSTVVTRVI
jgi:hypothetical protein